MIPAEEMANKSNGTERKSWYFKARCQMWRILGLSSFVDINWCRMSVSLNLWVATLSTNLYLQKYLHYAS